MASKPSCKDYGIPDNLAVPPGELITGWSDSNAHYTSRTILYNLHVIYDRQGDIIRRLDQSGHLHSHPSDNQSSMPRQSTPVSSAIETLERPNRGNDGRPDIVRTVPVEDYLEAVAAAAPDIVTSSSHPPADPPPLIRRFVKLNEVTKASPAGNLVLTSPKTSKLDAASMAPSDSVSSDLAGLFIDCSASNTTTSSPRTPPAADNDTVEELVSLPVPDDRHWARLHELGGSDDHASVSSSDTAKQEHLSLAYEAADSARSIFDGPICDLPAFQSPTPSASSTSLLGSSNGHSTSSRASSATKLPPETVRVHDHSSMAVTSSRRPSPHQTAGAPDWMTTIPAQAVYTAQQGPQQEEPVIPTRSPVVTQSGPKRTSATTITTTTTTTTNSNHTPPGFQQWRMLTERKPLKPSSKEKHKLEEYTFW
ncbi:MAG: hypothetical protein Q9185_004579 [Variospora sp. 1 TL-2023]